MLIGHTVSNGLFRIFLSSGLHVLEADTLNNGDQEVINVSESSHQLSILFKDVV